MPPRTENVDAKGKRDSLKSDIVSEFAPPSALMGGGLTGKAGRVAASMESEMAGSC